MLGRYTTGPCGVPIARHSENLTVSALFLRIGSPGLTTGKTKLGYQDSNLE